MLTSYETVKVHGNGMYRKIKLKIAMGNFISKHSFKRNSLSHNHLI